MSEDKYYCHSGSERYFEFDGKICDDESGKQLSSTEIVTILNQHEELNKNYNNILNVLEDIYNEMKEDGSMSFGRLKDYVVFE